MSEQSLHVIGYDEIVIMLGLLGIDGTIIENNQDIMKKLQELIKNPKISMIIIAADLPESIVEFIIDFKLNNRRPFIFYLQDVFKLKKDISDKGNLDLVLKKILDSIGNILN